MEPVSASETKARLVRAATLTQQLMSGAPDVISTTVREFVARVVVRRNVFTVTINAGALWNAGEPIVQRDVPMRLRRCGMAMRMVIEGPGAEHQTAVRGPDPNLVALLSRAHQWFDDLKSGRARSVQAIAKVAGMCADKATRVLYLAFLAPDIAERIVRGDHPPELNVTGLLDRVPLATDWARQRQVLGFSG